MPSEIELRQRAVEEEEAVSSIVEEVNFTNEMVMVLKRKRLYAILSRMLASKSPNNLETGFQPLLVNREYSPLSLLPFRCSLPVLSWQGTTPG